MKHSRRSLLAAGTALLLLLTVPILARGAALRTATLIHVLVRHVRILSVECRSGRHPQRTPGSSAAFRPKALREFGYIA